MLPQLKEESPSWERSESIWFVSFKRRIIKRWFYSNQQQHPSKFIVFLWKENGKNIINIMKFPLSTRKRYSIQKQRGNRIRIRIFQFSLTRVACLVWFVGSHLTNYTERLLKLFVVTSPNKAPIGILGPIVLSFYITRRRSEVVVGEENTFHLNVLRNW